MMHKSEMYLIVNLRIGNTERSQRVWQNHSFRWYTISTHLTIHSNIYYSVAILSQIHSQTSPTGIQAIVRQLEEKTAIMKNQIGLLKNAVPVDTVNKYTLLIRCINPRYNQMWSYTMQSGTLNYNMVMKACFIVAMIVFLKDGDLVTPENIELYLGRTFTLLMK
jgi:hypothetical protein